MKAPAYLSDTPGLGTPEPAPSIYTRDNPGHRVYIEPSAVDSLPEQYRNLPRTETDFAGAWPAQGACDACGRQPCEHTWQVVRIPDQRTIRCNLAGGRS